MKFTRIAIIDRLNDNVPLHVQEQIKTFSDAPVIFPADYPKTEEEIIARIGDADCILLSHQTPLTKFIIDNCQNIKYIGVAATNLQNIDVEAVKAKGITLTNVSDYGDEATAEYIFTQLLNLVRGIGEYQWKEEPAELNGKTIGIIGLGAVGKHVARLALGFNMKVLYYKRERDKEMEEKGLTYAQLDRLLQNSNIISLHVPKNLQILTTSEFNHISKGAILVNTCLGKIFSPEDFLEWISQGENFAIFDNNPEYEAIRNTKNVIMPNISAGKTMEAKERLSQKFLNNLKTYSEDK